MCCMFFFFFKQKTAYEMRISDWSSDVCSSDLIAARVMAGERLNGFDLKRVRLNHVAVKEAVFPFARFPGVDTLLGPEMKSTGEVMGIDRDFGRAFARSEERRVGKECVSTFRSRWSPYT